MIRRRFAPTVGKSIAKREGRTRAFRTDDALGPSLLQMFAVFVAVNVTVVAIVVVVVVGVVAVVVGFVVAVGAVVGVATS
jgi:hypothetical protein